ncbi:hypothetical protein K3181_00740 [Qipengyuania sp. YG27]|uniref:EamA domain-containing protein n=1 Tax=Qipengyuania mesophila TaxID=2867246 RepID=A0ABS7JQS6_9SPHN|nr:hypothetical protein [Qipengyuania mesophila]MBX7499966.1 hypothetical protein [Qipengyuania mesophila]
MIDDPVTLSAAYASGSVAISWAMARFSPTIGPRFRHVLAGGGPLAVVFAFLVEGHQSVTLHGMDLLAGGGLVGLGIASSVAVSKIGPARHDKRLRLGRR